MANCPKFVVTLSRSLGFVRFRDIARTCTPGGIPKFTKSLLKFESSLRRIGLLVFLNFEPLFR